MEVSLIGVANEHVLSGKSSFSLRTRATSVDVLRSKFHATLAVASSEPAINEQMARRGTPIDDDEGASENIFAVSMSIQNITDGEIF